MKGLLDTHLLLWALYEPAKLPGRAVPLIESNANSIWFSAASIWEIAIKAALGRPDFAVRPREARAEALRIGLRELVIDGAQAAAVADLPRLHNDPFDRLLIVQARATHLTLFTSDRAVAAYGDGITLFPPD
ncbi:MAG: type II toxin-antitoxin system VapC family toxin [Bifidobacteriaceae bacterium]|nr:type II toxin-antitoxin system VapC family toxin [Bifidobacteriaceae bacterium]